MDRFCICPNQGPAGRYWCRVVKQMLVMGNLSDLRKGYEAYHPQLPEFIAEAIQVCADKELN